MSKQQPTNADEFYSPSAATFASFTMEQLTKLGKQRGKSLITTRAICDPNSWHIPDSYTPYGYRTPFEQAAYDLEHTPKNRTSGPNLGEPLSINETTKDKQYILIAVCLILFALLIMTV
jgi:hypothetical protein